MTTFLQNFFIKVFQEHKLHKLSGFCQAFSVKYLHEVLCSTYFAYNNEWQNGTVEAIGNNLSLQTEFNFERETVERAAVKFCEYQTIYDFRFGYVILQIFDNKATHA